MCYKTNFGGVKGLKLNGQLERVKELTLLRELLARDLESQLQLEFDNYQAFKKIISAIEKELQANRGVLAAQKEQQKIGRVELTDILNNQDRVNSTYVRLLQTRQQNHMVRYKLKQLTGELLALFQD